MPAALEFISRTCPQCQWKITLEGRPVAGLHECPSCGTSVPVAEAEWTVLEREMALAADTWVNGGTQRAKSTLITVAVLSVAGVLMFLWYRKAMLPAKSPAETTAVAAHTVESVWGDTRKPRVNKPVTNVPQNPATREQKEAIARWEAEVRNWINFRNKMSPRQGSDLFGPVAYAKKLKWGLEVIDSSRLPQDLREAFDSMREMLVRMTDLMTENAPDDLDGYRRWIKAREGDLKFRQRYEEVTKDCEQLAKRLHDTALAYSVVDMKLMKD